MNLTNREAHKEVFSLLLDLLRTKYTHVSKMMKSLPKTAADIKSWTLWSA